LKLSPEDADENTLMFSMVSSESDLQICMILNRVLNISLAMAGDVIVKRKSGQIHFRKYIFENEDMVEKYILFSNYSGGEYLFPELKKNDFLLYINTEAVMTVIEERITQLKILPEISGVFKIDPSRIKSFHKIMF